MKQKDDWEDAVYKNNNKISNKKIIPVIKVSKKQINRMIKNVKKI